MIELIYTCEKAFIYDLNDWKKLRDEYRIIGEFIGATQYIPAFPFALLPEEAFLLIQLGIAKLVSQKTDLTDPRIKEYYDNLKVDILHHQKTLYLEERSKQIEHYKENIIKGKRKRGDTRSDEVILKEELDKPVNIDENTLLWPILVKSPYTIQTDVDKHALLTHTTEVRCKTYEDLWKRGFFITSGEKFGGDFLVYLGDPIQFHAVYIIRCLDDCNQPIHTTEVVAFGRLGTSVKKKAILASLNPDISYISLNWIDA